MMKKYLDDLLFFSGSALIVIGAGMIYLPAAFIVAGCFCITFGYMIGKVEANDANQ